MSHFRSSLETRPVVCFFENMAARDSSALLLDYDGTLAPFRVDPATAVPYPGVIQRLHRIRQCKRNRLVFISGRRAGEVNQFLGLENVEIWGCHGMERLRTDGSLEEFALDEKTLKAIGNVALRLREEGLGPLIEDKPVANAVHWRGLSTEQAEAVKEKVEIVWAGLPDRDRLRILRFDGGIEICAASMNKGDVVRQIALEVGESCAIAYMGDDVTDEDAFQALKGIGLSILVRESHRETAADIWIHPPGELLDFLDNWIRVCGSIA